MKNFKKTSNFNKKVSSTRASFAKRKGHLTSGNHAFGTSTEKYLAICNECHKECEVPFRPNGKKPVYCSDCFDGKTNIHTTNFKNEKQGQDNLKRQFTILNTKLDKLIEVIETQNRLLSKAKK